MDILEKVKQFIIDGYGGKKIYATVIANKFKITKPNAYKVVGILRTEGFGIHTTSRGYVASEFATQKDDVNFVSRMCALRKQADRALRPAVSHILDRWPNGQMRPLLRSVYSDSDLKGLESTGDTIIDLGKRLDDLASKDKKSPL